MEKLALIISFLSFIVSIIVAYIYYLGNKQVSKLNKTNLEAKYYEEIFVKYLLKSIPKARRYIYFNKPERKLDVGYKELTSIITSMRKDILYFYYRNIEVYRSINNNLTDIDEYIVRMACKIDVQYSEEKDFLDNLDIKINKLYKCIFDNYLGN